MQIATARPSSSPVDCPPFFVVRRLTLEHTSQKKYEHRHEPQQPIVIVYEARIAESGSM